MPGWRERGSVRLLQVYIVIRRCSYTSFMEIVAEEQYNDIISAPDAWHLSDDTDDEALNEKDVRPSNSARRVKALIEQITGTHAIIPSKSIILNLKGQILPRSI